MNKFKVCLSLLLLVFVMMGAGTVLGLLFPKFEIPLIAGGILALASLVLCFFQAAKKAKSTGKRAWVFTVIVSSLSGFSEGLALSAIFIGAAPSVDTGSILASFTISGASALGLYAIWALVASLEGYGRHPKIYTGLIIGVLLVLSIAVWITAGHAYCFPTFLLLSLSAMLIPLFTSHGSTDKLCESISVASALVALLAVIIAFMVLAEDADLGILDFLDADFESPINKKRKKDSVLQS